MLRIVLASLALVASAVAGGTAHGATTVRSFAANSTITPTVSSNWSGYAAVAADTTTAPVTFTDVTGTWVQPKAKCTGGRSDASAFWVGLGGYDETSGSLEQLGTAAECDGVAAKATNYAWWELVPAASVRIPLKINAGDAITAAVFVQGQQIIFSLRDLTRKTRFSKIVHAAQQLDLASAEWIAEAPSNCSSFGNCHVVPLTNFGTVTFSKAAAIGNSHPGTITDATWTATPIELIAGGNSGFFGGLDDSEQGTGAVPGDVSTDGRSFAVSWAQNLTPPAG